MEPPLESDGSRFDALPIAVGTAPLESEDDLRATCLNLQRKHLFFEGFAKVLQVRGNGMPVAADVGDEYPARRQAAAGFPVELDRPEFRADAFSVTGVGQDDVLAISRR